MLVSEAASALETTCAALKVLSDNMTTALCGDVPCSEEFLKNIKTFMDKTGESVTELRGTLCDIAVPEILTTACLREQLKRCLEPASFIVSGEGSGGGVPGLFSPAATLKEDLRIYHTCGRVSYKGQQSACVLQMLLQMMMMMQTTSLWVAPLKHSL